MGFITAYVSPLRVEMNVVVWELLNRHFHISLYYHLIRLMISQTISTVYGCKVRVPGNPGTWIKTAHFL